MSHINFTFLNNQEKVSQNILEKKDILWVLHEKSPNCFTLAERRWIMDEQKLDFVLKLVILGFVIILVCITFSKDIKDFHITIDQNGIEINSAYYKE
jgi:hypothetical protein